MLDGDACSILIPLNNCERNHQKCVAQDQVPRLHKVASHIKSTDTVVSGCGKNAATDTSIHSICQQSLVNLIPARMVLIFNRQWKELYPDLHIRTAVCSFTFTLPTCYSQPLLSAIDEVFVYTVFQTNSETRTASNNLDPVLVSEQLGEESLHQEVG